MSHTYCAAEATLWSMADGLAPGVTDDQADNNKVNERNWALKEAQTITISSGFRIWADPYST